MKLTPMVMLASVVTASAVAQTATDPCRSGPDPRPVFQEVLRHFQVMEGALEVRPLDRAVQADRYGPDVAPAAADFNARNAADCAAADAPPAGLHLIAGPQKTRLSRVGFDGLATTAFAEITMIGGPEIGSSHFVILRKTDGAWKVVEEQQYRIF